MHREATGLEERLSRNEALTRKLESRLKLAQAIAFVAVGLNALAWFPMRGDAQADASTVKAPFKVVGQSGRLLMTVSDAPHQPSLTLFSPSGIPILDAGSQGTIGGGAALRLYRSDGQFAVASEVNTFPFTDEQTKQPISFPGLKTSFLVPAVQNGQRVWTSQTASTLVETRAGGSFALWNYPSGTMAARLTAKRNHDGKAGGGALLLYDTSGNELTSIGYRK